MNKIDELEAALKVLCNEYQKEFGMTVIIELDGDGYDILGNLCPVCAKEALEGLIEKENLDHFPNVVH